MENIRTPLGHVTMVPKGTYDSTTTYNRLDLVTYTNNNNLGVYVSKQDNLQNIPPSTTTAWMKLIDSNDTKGPQGDIGPTGPTGPAAGFGTITGIAEPLNSSDNPTIEIEPLNNDNTAKSFKFKFGIPVGKQGAQGPTGPTGNALVINPIEFELKGDQMRFGLFENGNDANVELRTAYSGNQVGITISQYTQGFSQRQKTLTLLNSQGNTSIPGDLTIAGDLNLNKPLSVESGGTNINSNPSMIINLSSTQAANVFNTNPQPGVTGILPIAQGGTGASTSTGAITNLGITPANIGALSLNGGSLTGHLTLKNARHLYFESATTNGLQNAFIYLRGANEAYGNNISIWYNPPVSNPHGNQLYQLPEYDNTLTAGGNYYYKVLTSKNPVTIAQGGTGASTSTQARTNLGITPTNIGAMSLNPTHIELIPESGNTHGGFIDFHYSGNSSADYTSRIIEDEEGQISIKGTLKLDSTGFRTYNNSGYKLDAFGNFRHLDSTTTTTWNIVGFNSTVKYSINFETGDINTYGQIVKSSNDSLYVNPRNRSTIKAIDPGDSNTYYPIIDIAGKNGDWSIGSNSYNTSNSASLLFNYVSNNNYNTWFNGDSSANRSYRVWLPATPSANGDNYIFAGKAIPSTNTTMINALEGGGELATNTIVIVYEP